MHSSFTSLLFVSARTTFLFLFLLFVSVLHAQQRTINGMVRNSTDKEPLANISVQVQGTERGTVTDNKGAFSVEVATGETIVFTGVGYTTQQIVLKAQTLLTIDLVRSDDEMENVVVTALGIKRQEKALGYAATTLKGEELTNAVSNNWTDALSGKVAGLNLIRSGAGPAGSNKIILRGENALTNAESNEALIVVDGVVINGGSGRRTSANAGAYLDSDSPADYGSGLGDINPEDIESVTVLKGAGAAALYGQRGANGAIMITTKSGRMGKKKWNLTVNSNTSIERVNRWPKFQYEYGQGDDGNNYYSYNASVDGPNTRSTSSAWGPKFDGQMYFQYNPITHTQDSVRTLWQPYPQDNNRFFKTGFTTTNSVTLDGGDNNTYVRLSATNLQNKWIIPNTGYNRNNVSLSVTQKIEDKLQLNAKVDYTNRNSDNLPNAGYNNQSFMYWYLFWVPSANIDWLKDYWLPGEENVKQSYPFSSYPDNPYLIAYQMLNKSNRNGITGNVQAIYNFTKELSLMVRTSLDYSNEQRSQQRPFDTEKFKQGMFRTQNIFSQEVSTDFLAKYTKKLSDFDFSVSAGGSSLRNKYNKDDLRADILKYPGLFTLGNAGTLVLAYPTQSKLAVNSLYGLITTGYKNFLFLDFTARNDWISTLATPDRSDGVDFFYPSINGSFILSEAFKMPKSINYLKLRASVAGVGSGTTNAYMTSYTYEPLPNFPGAVRNPRTLPNPNLRPYKNTSYEIGTEGKLFNNRFGFDIAAYISNAKDQILETTLDRASGYDKAIVNAGTVQNKGIEVALNGTPVKSKGSFEWNLFTTFSYNENTIKSLGDSILTLQTGPGSRGAVIATVGGSMGDFYGRGYQRAPDGQIIYDENGLPKLTDDMILLGNTIPKWKLSIGNEFRYKQFKFNFLFDGQYGAIAYSLSSAVMAEQGKSKVTLPGRYNGIIGDGVVDNGDGTYKKNDVIAENLTAYYTAHYGRDNVEGTSYSTDFIKLREARLAYAIPQRTINKIGLQRAEIGIYGRDLFIFTKWPAFDPEFGTLNGTDITRGFELGQFPSTRTIGINLIVGL